MEKQNPEYSEYFKCNYCKKNIMLQFGIKRHLDECKIVNKTAYTKHQYICENGVVKKIKEEDDDDQIPPNPEDPMSKYVDDKKDVKFDVSFIKTSDNMSDDQNLIANEVEVLQSNDDKSGLCTIITEIKNLEWSEMVHQMVNILESNSLECFDQKHMSNSSQSSLEVIKHDIEIKNEDLNIKEKEDSLDIKNDTNLEKLPEKNHDIKRVRGTKYFSIKKSLNVEKVSSVTNFLNSGQTSNCNDIYLCDICKKSSADPDLFALHMCTHKECSMHECSVCDQMFSTVILWANHMNHHQQQVNLSGSQIHSAMIEPTTPMRSERQVRLSTLKKRKFY